MDDPDDYSRSDTLQSLESMDWVLPENPFKPSDWLDDTSRWVCYFSRMETPQFVKDEMAQMMAEFIASLPEDSLALAFWRILADWVPETAEPR